MRGFSGVSWRVKFESAPDPGPVEATFGSGIMFSSASAFGSSRFVGMMLPAKHPGPPVVTLHAPLESGSLINISRPLASKVCEKSPLRSSAVGMR
jgi:hypothetical protein